MKGKTMNHVISPEDGSVYTHENGELIQYPISADGGWDPTEGASVDWSRGVSPEDEPRLREIETRLLRG